MEKYEYLASLRWSDNHLFYRLLIDNMKEIAPLVYTPVVGEACQRFSHIYAHHPEGMYLSLEERGHLKEVLQNYPADDIDICVVTDGSRILGLGDLGINGLGIPIGKLSLYVACAGVVPERTLPIVLDYGTNNQDNLADPFYLGLRHPRVSAQEGNAFVDEFIEAARERWPNMIIQFEDFNTEMAFDILHRWQNKTSCFNDDIQGTGAVVLAGIINAIKVSGTPLEKHKFVFFGAGSAGVGVAEMMMDYFKLYANMSDENARGMFYLVDSKGLVANNRGDKSLPAHKKLLSRREPDTPRLKSLEEVVEYVKPTALLGLSTVGSTFTEPVIRKMAAFNKRPIVFPLSNPSSKSECTFKEALEWTDGRCLFASGSPFDDETYKGETYVAGQGNNVYVFPALGLGSILCKASRVTQRMIFAAAAALANSLTPAETKRELMYPELHRIRDVSAIVASGVIKAALEDGVGRDEGCRRVANDDRLLLKKIREDMYDPKGPEVDFKQSSSL